METIKIQNARPGMYVSTPEMDTFKRVTEFPIITGQGVFVDLIGDQIGPLPVDAPIEVDGRW